MLGYDWDTREERLAELKKTLGPDLWNSVMKMREDRMADYPLLVREYYEDQEALKPYWNIADNIAAREGAEAEAEWKRYKAMSKEARMEER